MLVVDDDAEMRAVFSEYIRLQGFHVLEAKDGLEALLQVKRTRPHAIILDLAMPRLGGIDALKRVVQFDPTITVVVVTGETDTDLLRQASLLGVRAVLAKPVALPDLLSALPQRGMPQRQTSRPGSSLLTTIQTFSTLSASTLRTSGTAMSSRRPHEGSRPSRSSRAPVPTW